MVNWLGHSTLKISDCDRREVQCILFSDSGLLLINMSFSG